MYPSFGNTNKKTAEFTLVSVELESEGENSIVEALVVESITAPIPMKVPQEWLEQPLLQGLKLADNFSDDVLHVELIIGNDYYGSLITGQIVQEDSIMAMESKFGWLLSGPVNQNSAVTMNQVSCYSVTTTEVDDETLDEKLQKFWEVNAYEYDEVKADERIQ